MRRPLLPSALALVIAVFAASPPAGSTPLPCDPDDPGAWLLRIDPIHELIVGSPRRDALAAGAAGDVVIGLGGSDELVSHWNRTALIGGSGHDTLVTDAIADDPDRGIGGLVIQRGGTGHDGLAATLGVVGPRPGELLLDLGHGHDVLEARVHRAEPCDCPSHAALSTLILGDGGNDFIEAVADDQGAWFYSSAVNTIHAGAGADRVSVRAITEFDAEHGLAENLVTGGSGDDQLDATAINWSYNDVLPDRPATNRLDGGSGHDVMRASCLTDSNNGDPLGRNELRGGSGNDVLEAIHSTDGENYATDLTTLLEGGSGRDDLRAHTLALGGAHVNALNRLAGGPGSDTLSARMVPGVGRDSFFDLLHCDVANHLEGGAGDDELEAWIAPDPDEPRYVGPCFTQVAENHLDGGPGSDVLVAGVETGEVGSSFVFGGPGSDHVTVVGGDDNLLDGGDGNDELFAGSGADLLIGGRGRDLFHFDAGADQGTNTLDDFDARRDRLGFAGVADAGAPGLADDLDAVSSFSDPAPGGDLLVDLDSGTRIVFARRGTGATSSWAAILGPGSAPSVVAATHGKIVVQRARGPAPLPLGARHRHR